MTYVLELESNNMAQQNKSEEIFKTYTPVIIFIIATFFLEQFGLTKANNLIVSVFLSMISFMVMTALLKEKYGDYPQRKKLSLQSGVLTTMFIIIFANGFLHWYKIGHMNLRWGIFFALLLIYFILLSRSVHVLRDIRLHLETSDKKGKK
jgi:uncharacterized membrane protein